MVVGTIASCKKDKNDPSCEKSVAGIAATYKITKVTVKVPNFPEQDVTNSMFDACELAATYQLKSDKTVVYTESAACGGSGTGTWDVLTGGNITWSTSGNSFDFPTGASATTAISGWDCTSLVLTEVVSGGGGQTYTYTFTKQ